MSERTLLDSILAGLDYANNASRAAVVGALDPKQTMLGNLTEAAKGNLQVSAADVAAQLGIPNVGQDDGKFQAGDIVDFGRDMAIDIALDPLTYVSAGLAKLPKAAALAGRAAAEGASLTKPAVNALKAAQTLDKFAPAAIGGLYGIGAGEQEDSLLERIAKVGVGAAAGAGVKKYGPTVGKMVREAADYGSDLWGKAAFNLPALGTETVPRAYGEILPLIDENSRYIKSGYANAVKDLSQTEQKDFYDLMTGFMNRTKEERNAIADKMWSDRGQMWQKADKETKNQVWGQATRQATAKLEPQFQAELKNLADSGKPQLQTAVDRWLKFGEEFRKRVNVEARGFSEKDYKDLFGESLDKSQPDKYFLGQKYYVPTPHELDAAPDLFDDPIKISNAAKQSFETRESKLDDILKALDVYAVRNSKLLLNEDQTRVFSDFLNWKSDSNPGSKIIQGYDAMQNFVKRGLLHASITWHVSNFWDNGVKAYLENGLGNVIKENSLSSMLKGYTSDIYRMAKGKDLKFNASDLEQANRLGILSKPSFRALIDEDLKPFITPEAVEPGARPTLGPNLSEKITKLKSTLGENELSEKAATYATTMAKYARKAADKYTEMLDLSANAGSAMEGASKVALWKRMQSTLKKSDVYKSLAKDNPDKAAQWVGETSADFVKKAFFNYDDVSHAEVVLKRAIPFFAFYKRNFQYWSDALLDPVKVSRLANIEGVRSNIADPATERDKTGLSDYLLGNSPQKLGKDERGERFMVSPKLSYYDAIKTLNPTKFASDTAQKLSPLIKTPIEMVTGVDTFSGQKLFPSDTRTGTKDLYGRGYLYSALGLADLDRKNSPVTNSDALVTADKIRQLALPLPILDQIASMTGKTYYEKADPADLLTNLLSPLQTVTVTPGQKARTILDHRNKERARARFLQQIAENNSDEN